MKFKTESSSIQKAATCAENAVKYSQTFVGLQGRMWLCY